MNSPQSSFDDRLSPQPTVRISTAQHLIWLSQTVAKDVPLYNMALSYSIRGAVDTQRFVEACDQLVISSDTLQSVLADADSEHPRLQRDLAIRANCAVIPQASAEAATRWIRQRSSTPLDPRVCMFDCALLTISEQLSIFYWCQHHLSTDGSTIPLLIDGINRVYQSGHPAQTPSFYAFLQQQHEQQQTQRYHELVEYWRAKSAIQIDTPVFFGKVFDHSHAKVRRTLDLSPVQREKLDTLVSQPGFRAMNRKLSLFVLFATVLLATGFRLHGQQKLNLGFPASVRRDRSMQQLLGLVSGIGFLQLDIQTDDSFVSLAQRILREVVQTFPKLAPGIQTEQTQQSFSSSVNILDVPVGTFDGHPMDVEWHFTGYSDANSQLDLNLLDFSGHGRFELSLDMAVSVFGEQEQTVFIEVFMALLDAVLDDPHGSPATVNLFSEDQRQQILHLGQSAQAADIPADRLESLFIAQVARTPDAIALREGDTTMTFRQLDQQARAVAATLQQQSISPGDHVALCCKRSLLIYPAMLGCMMAGAVFVPLDPAYPDDRLAYMLENSQARVLLCGRDTDIEFAAQQVKIIYIDEAVDCSQAFRNIDVNTEPSERGDALYIMYTSGSTGLPKGVIGTHQATLNRFNWMWRNYPFQLGEVCCQKTALSFVDSIWELFGPLLQGVPVVIIPDELVLDIFAFVDVLESEQISRLVVVPSFLSVLLDADAALGDRLRSLELCVVSGEPLPMHVALAFLNQLSHCRLLNLYGSTEVTADVTADLVSHDKLSLRMPVGKPIDGVNIHIVDEQLNLLPRGAVGEIVVTGAGLSGGYFRQEALDQEKFIANPFGSGRLFRTGDLGRFTERGLIEHHGRRDMQIKIRGHRIEAAEIENAILNVDAVRAAVVHVSEQPRLFAFYTLQPGRSLEPEQLLTQLKAKLPDYMLPELVPVAQIPLLGNGKINKKALARLVPHRHAESAGIARTDTEELLATIWKSTLALETVDLHADFFDLGGNSIAAMRIMVGARKAGIILSLKEILEIGTIAGIAVEIDSNPMLHSLRSTVADAVVQQADQDLQQLEGRASPAQDDEMQIISELIAGNELLDGGNNVDDMFHLTPTQRGILFHQLLQGEDAPLYLTQVRCDLQGRIEPELFRQAWQVVVQRHDMLRSLILHEGLQEPVQVVARAIDIDLRYEDLCHLSADERARFCDELAQQRLDKPIALSKAPMWRAAILRTDEQCVHLVLDWHHILMDGWSLAVVSNEVLLVYYALQQGQPHGLPQAGRFRDHVVAIRSQDSSAIRSFWQQRLAGLSTPTPVSRQAQQSAEGISRSHLARFMDEESSNRLYEFARACRVTPNTVAQAAWALLLARYNDTDDVLFGFALTGRSSGINNYESTVGMFVNSLPLRVNCHPDTSLVDWLQATQTSQMELVEYEHSPLVDIQQASELPASQPMFDSLLVFQNLPRLTVSQHFPLEVHDRRVHENNPTPITIELFAGWQLELQVMYIKEAFEEYPVEQVIDQYINVIKAICACDSNARLADIDLMGEEAIRQLSVSFNQTQADYPRHLDVSDLVWQQAQKTPHNLAVSFGNTCLTYAELTLRADALASYLQTRELRPDDLVAVCLHRSEQLLVALLAVMRAGLAYLPIDPDFPDARINAILDDAGIDFMLTSTDVHLTSPQAVSYETLLIDTQWQALVETADHSEVSASVSRTLQQPTPNNLAYVIYTSGSTGKPKGVRITRANMVNFLCSMSREPGISASDRLLAVTTVSFDIAVLELFLPLINGASVDIAPRDMTFDGFAIRTRIEQQQINVMQATPTTWRLLLAAKWSAGPHFRALVGGEALPRDLAAELISLGAALWNMYGPTETTVWSSCEQIIDASDVISIGRPIANTEILILDDKLNLCPPGIPGELCIAGDGVSAGYVNRPELMAEKFIAHPLQPVDGQSVYRTGDLARWMPDGRLECLGRIDSQVKLRGYRIELGEIESMLAAMDPIDHAVVNLVSVGGQDLLAAYLVAHLGQSDQVPNEVVLRDRLRQSLPQYMIPATFMLIDEVPRLPNGKIDRQALPAPLAGAGNLADLASIDSCELPENQPATDTEAALSQIWQRILFKDRVSVNSNFFDLGGNSISAMQIMSACKQQAIHLNIMDIFELGSIRQCALAIDARIAGDKQEPLAPPGHTETLHNQADLQRIASLLNAAGNAS